MHCCERFLEGVGAVHKIQKVIRVGDLIYPPPQQAAEDHEHILGGLLLRQETLFLR